MPSLKTISEGGARVLEQRTERLTEGESRKVDRGLGYMPVHTEFLRKSSAGSVYSVAHYFLSSSGDLVPDPDVEFLKHAGGWTPLSFCDARIRRVAVHSFARNPPDVDESELTDLVAFCETWLAGLANVADQQGLATTRAR